MPLPLLGIPDDMFLAVGFVHLAAMAWLHTERIGTLGWLEGSINTPSLHRVHHSSDPRDHDRNFGGVLVIYDRLFGTYAEPREQFRDYGVHGQEAVRGIIEAHLIPLFAWWRTTRLGKKRDLATG